MNEYAYAVNPEVLATVYEQTGRPIMVGEFHNGTPGRGLAAAFPAFIGASRFTWADESVTGRMDGENYNIGLMDVNDRPYRELVEAMKTTHRRLYAVHSGKEQPFSQKARTQ